MLLLDISSKRMTGPNMLGQTCLRLMGRLGAITVPAIRFVDIYRAPQEQRPAGRGCRLFWPWCAPSQPLDEY